MYRHFSFSRSLLFGFHKCSVDDDGRAKASPPGSLESNPTFVGTERCMELLLLDLPKGITASQQSEALSSPEVNAMKALHSIDALSLDESKGPDGAATSAAADATAAPPVLAGSVEMMNLTSLAEPKSVPPATTEEKSSGAKQSVQLKLTSQMILTDIQVFDLTVRFPHFQMRACAQRVYACRASLAWRIRRAPIAPSAWQTRKI